MNDTTSIKEIEIIGKKIFKKETVSLENFTVCIKRKFQWKRSFLNSSYQDGIITIPKSDNDNTRQENDTSIFLINTDTKIFKKISISYSTMYHNQVGFITGI